MSDSVKPQGEKGFYTNVYHPVDATPRNWRPIGSTRPTVPGPDQSVVGCAAGKFDLTLGNWSSSQRIWVREDRALPGRELRIRCRVAGAASIPQGLRRTAAR